MPKPVADAITIAWMDILRNRPHLLVWWFILLLLPLANLFFARHLVPEGIEVGPRLIAGSTVFMLGIFTVQAIANDLAFMRFTYRLKLIVACPVHPASYIFGIMFVPTARGAINSIALLAFAPLFDIDIHLNLWYIPVAALTAMSLCGIGMVIGSWSPNIIVNNQISLVFGVIVVMVSPVYFAVERLPDWLQGVARLSPYTHAANALDAILSGRGGFHDEVAILAAITAVTMTIGLAGMRWRET